MIILTILAFIFLLGIGIFLYEMKNAIEINPKEPFLHGDFDECK